jgi:isoleucyl-tRNA synthetase
LDILLNCLTTWLAPALPFTAEETWMSRYGDSASVHLALFPEVPDTWRNENLAAKWKRIRSIRSNVYQEYLEAFRREKKIGSSLQAEVIISELWCQLLPALDWADVFIVSKVELNQDYLDKAYASLKSTVPPEERVAWDVAPGEKCERCWRFLEEVNKQHLPGLCIRCCDAVDYLTSQ